MSNVSAASATALQSASASRSARTAGVLDMGLPAGRRSPRGRLRWYAARVPEGQEAAYAARLARVVPTSALEGALFPRREKWEKRAGRWATAVKPLYPGYVFLASRDAAALAKVLDRLTLRAELAGALGRDWAPLSDEAAAWLIGSLDRRGVLRSSTGAVVAGALTVWDGPLTGREECVEHIDRHRRVATVRIGSDGASFTELAPLDVRFKGTSAEFEAWLAREGLAARMSLGPRVPSEPQAPLTLAAAARN